MENNVEVPQKIKTSSTIRSSSAMAGYLLKENKNTNTERYMNCQVQGSIIYSSQDMEATEVSIYGWMEKENVMCIHKERERERERKKGLLFSHKKGNLAICNQMDGPWQVYAKWNQTKTNTVCSHWYVDAKKNFLNTDTEDRLVVVRGRVGAGEQWVKGLKRYYLQL